MKTPKVYVILILPTTKLQETKHSYEEWCLHSHRRENLKSYKKLVVLAVLGLTQFLVFYLISFRR
jgi:hypothetical protein